MLRSPAISLLRSLRLIGPSFPGRCPGLYYYCPSRRNCPSGRGNGTRDANRHSRVYPLSTTIPSKLLTQFGFEFGGGKFVNHFGQFAAVANGVGMVAEVADDLDEALLGGGIGKRPF